MSMSVFCKHRQLSVTLRQTHPTDNKSRLSATWLNHGLWSEHRGSVRTQTCVVKRLRVTFNSDRPWLCSRHCHDSPGLNVTQVTEFTDMDVVSVPLALRGMMHETSLLTHWNKSELFKLPVRWSQYRSESLLLKPLAQAMHRIWNYSLGCPQCTPDI